MAAKAKRSIIVSIPGGTATTTVSIPLTATLKRVVLSAIPAAAGSWEFSRSSTSQIASATPDVSVFARLRFAAPLSAVGVIPPANVTWDMDQKFTILDYLYIHCTGAGNVGEVTLIFE